MKHPPFSSSSHQAYTCSSLYPTIPFVFACSCVDSWHVQWVVWIHTHPQPPPMLPKINNNSINLHAYEDQDMNAVPPAIVAASGARR
mmetsp:Transcript_13804/g.16258  ORF Transcript_13804/g.16258 Transcript_13804/m.16258 type:complete len:87 (-) Transcript_13804:276-536(-)